MIKKIGRSKNKKYFFILTVAILLSLIVSVLVGKYLPMYKLNKATSALNNGAVTYENLATWLAAYYDTGFPITNDNEDLDNDLAFALDTYSLNYEKFNDGSIYNLEPLGFQFGSANIDIIENSEEVVEDPNIPQFISFTKVKGEDGNQLVLGGTLATYNSSVELNFFVAEPRPMQPHVVVQGTAENSVIAKQISGDMALLSDSSNNVQVLGISTDTEEVLERLEKIDFDNWELIEIEYSTSDEGSKRNNGQYLVAKVWLKNKDCDLKSYLNYVYDPSTDSMTFDNWQSFSDLNCDQAQIPSNNEVVVLACDDCSLAPISKYTKLPQGYVPENLLEIEGKQLSKETIEAYKNLSSELKKKELIFS